MWQSKHKTELAEKRERALLGGGEEKIARQHSQGKLTARERLNYLFDKDTFEEIGSLVESRSADLIGGKAPVEGDGAVVGYGKINGRLIFASAQDFTYNGGTLGEYAAKKICRVMDLAYDNKAPYIAINDSGGARIEEGIDSQTGYGEIFFRNTKLSGVVPQISVILGPCAGGACYSPAISDFIFMSRGKGQMYITGPGVVKTVIGEDVTTEALGGADIHSQVSGVSHFVYDTDEECLDAVKTLLDYLPQSTEECPAETECHFNTDNCAALEDIVPENPRRTYDVHSVITSIIDKDSFLEVQKDYAKNIVIGFSRINGEVIGIVANQPNILAGVLEVNASDKAARFVRFCDCFNIPLLTFVDVSGYMPGTKEEHAGIIRHGAKLLYAYAEATVPKVSVIMRKAYGGAYIAMNSKGLGADMVFAWPIAEIAVMGADGAVNIINKKEIAASANPSELKASLVEKYEEKYLTPYVAAARGYIDDVIEASETRIKVAHAFEMLKNKDAELPCKKHGNIPL